MTDWTDVTSANPTAPSGSDISVIYKTFAQVGTDADTTEKTLGTYTLPAKYLDANGKGVRLEVYGFADTENTTRNLYFGSTVVETAGPDNPNGFFKYSVDVWRDAEDSQLSFSVGSKESLPFSRLIHIDATAVGTDDATKKTLMTYTIPANTLKVDNDSLYIIACLTTATNANTKAVTMEFDGTTFYTDSSTTSNKVYFVEGHIIRTGAGAQEILSYGTRTNSDAGTARTTDAADETAGIVFNLTGDSDTASANDVVAQWLKVFYHPAPASANPLNYDLTLAEDDGADIIIKFTGQNAVGTANSVLMYGMAIYSLQED